MLPSQECSLLSPFLSAAAIKKSTSLHTSALVAQTCCIYNTSLVCSRQHLHCIWQRLDQWVVFDSGIGIYAALLQGNQSASCYSAVAVATGICALPGELKWKTHGGWIAGGIGFTMSIFVTLLAFTDPHLIDLSKISLILDHFTAGILGLAGWRSYEESNSAKKGILLEICSVKP